MTEGNEQKKKILIVEDNDFVRMQIRKYLEGADYAVVEATHGDEAIEVVRKDNLDLAVVDVRMEPVGGFEFVRMMQAEGVMVPVILVTGDQNLDILEQAGKWGIQTVLLKPVQKDRLISMVGRALR